ncbi:lipoprotein-anchoring transpeptidase ErfK/SrfK [Pararhizobium capsulatum DSM 1112]|uniref:Lipoprotein-anchoring transpeptidase ErfK/SrfK n=1 Tax=Pararhizobium capsulatum DSM 1112 TaxID=1121113 RepID=A0ABU0BTI6_9HYPH|nr:L,D-transpeptidase [Pararhizobium capsulatum]MDQ0320976.1 lipoprotein-anchoring transpeptidase ErfK/SrfK [Pararhizobium capsulatum DSM 1112]
MTRRIRTTIALFAAASAFSLCAGATLAQDFGRLPPDAVLVTPQGEILDYIPESSEVSVMRDRRGRTVLVDNWGNIVATVMGSGRQRTAPDGFGRREASRDDNQGYGYSVRRYGDTVYSSAPDYRDPAFRQPGDITGSIPDDGDSMQGIQRQPLPDASAPDENDSAALPPLEESPRGPTLPPAAAIGKKSSAEITALQVFLDREGFSPGVIDGKKGSNVTKAIEAWQQATGETLDPNNTDDILERLRLSGGLPITSYEISAADAAGPYVASIPEDYAHKAALPHLSYTSTTEMLGEKFHMDENYLRELNPGVDFTVPGTIIKVISPGEKKTGKVARVIADKARKQILAYDDAGTLIAAYPASIGSSDTPSPSGTVQVDRIALEPGYTYNPKINFQQGANDKVLNIPPGPNGPVGTVWIALSKPTYGIHGTPEPSKIGKTQSHGCIRLTNWDATELAKMVSVGTTVEFVD